MTEDDRLVRDYLRKLRHAARRLPRQRRQELLDEITTHIAEARAPETGSGDVPAILARLGDPRDIVRAAGGPAAGRAGGLEIAAAVLLLVGGFLAGIGWLVGCVLLWVSPRWRWPDKLLGTLVWPGGLLAPFLLLGLGVSQGACVSSSGSAGPVNPATGGAIAHPLPAATTCGPSHIPPAWLLITLAVIVVAAPVLVTVRLLRRARQEPGVHGAADVTAVAS